MYLFILIRHCHNVKTGEKNKTKQRNSNDLYAGQGAE